MLKKWVGEVVGDMHILRISNKQLAAHMGVTEEYISMVLNGHREPSGIESRIRKAIAEISTASE
jgi:plasmid maintenance system antidote protein VapI